MDLQLTVQLGGGQHSCEVELNSFRQTEVEFEDVFIPTEGQTEFTLSEEPDPEAIIRIYVNGVLSNDEFTVDETTLTFIETGYDLGPTDIVRAYYN